MRALDLRKSWVRLQLRSRRELLQLRCLLGLRLRHRIRKKAAAAAAATAAAAAAAAVAAATGGNQCRRILTSRAIIRSAEERHT